MMKWNQYLKGVIGLLIVSLVFITCEDFDDEKYELSALDEAAVSSMADTLENSLLMRSAAIYDDGTNLGVRLVGGGTDTIIMAVDTSGLELIDIYNALGTAGRGPFAVNDTAFVTRLSADSLSFRLLSATSAGTYVIYLNHHAQPSIFEENSGSMLRVELESDDMTPELVASLYSLPGPVPVIKGRYEFELAAGTYLFELARMEATTLDDFRVVLMREQ
ncbi:MAG: hypothetical protein HOD43_06790 [Candidatus Marinimicrobia bacterium]|nr:hypothetical protein [Candidatus Neomarinimicrobiota bacterium]MBT3630052.1 hypothetical protein [Candidatus Neomarinimicrobiota bacterium]MBT3824219.1 hypothetical protein [Candidatus Neomarinimicrobiota bacterium]MBT4130152.1 hypothetical protein [Candidatus Neomarinimicrobiota bacterium]MBT4295499.1 hypothetical protein [Candidatus Neomarinimicrobiota bacterium]